MKYMGRSNRRFNGLCPPREVGVTRDASHRSFCRVPMSLFDTRFSVLSFLHTRPSKVRVAAWHGLPNVLFLPSQASWWVALRRQCCLHRSGACVGGSHGFLKLNAGNPWAEAGYRRHERSVVVTGEGARLLHLQKCRSSAFA